ncbi:hypothetical protein HPB51_020515 [Rhipicephalus microplus]|uniref:Uncharacterized protein n=1 Tax=Rhipicephalus microplus TaxID=6941 RepID=A0A9J6EU41_RHIMP|nr:hypothetical protein HPB51_020515 [Rhipicephalus microplus]
MGHEVRLLAQELDLEELNRRIPGLNLNAPCSGTGVGEDYRSVPTSVCHIFDYLSRWNYVLWHVGLQLREPRCPGKLSLVRVVYRGSAGCMQRVRSHYGRILFHVLLVKHSCLESAHVDETLVEGGGLGECRECVVSALEKNTSLRTLTLGSLFDDYKSIREGVLTAISSMTNLRELVILGRSVEPEVLLDAICPLLVDTMCLATLSMPKVVFDGESSMRLIGALMENDTVEDLSVHVSILHSYIAYRLPAFSHFLATGGQLTSLSVEGVYSDPEGTCAYIESIVEALVLRGELEQLRLTGFLLNAECTALLARLVSEKDGCLRSLDVSGCQWSIPRSLSEHQRVDRATRDEQPVDAAVFKKSTCLWVQAYDHTALVKLTFLALSFAGLKPVDLLALLNVAVTIDYLQTISLRDVSRYNLVQVCRAIWETGMSGRVRLEDTYIVDSSVLAELREFPEVVRKMAISSVGCVTPKAFGDMVHLSCSRYKVTTLKLLLTQEVLSDIPTFAKLSKCLRSSLWLSELTLIGYKQPDLDLALKSADPPRSVLLQAISQNMSLRALRLSGIRLGEDNLLFLAYQVVTGKTLSDIFFASWDLAENDFFLKVLADQFRRNNTVTKLHVRVPSNSVDDERWFVIDDVISRNTGNLTCAAHFLLGDRSPRCEAAYKALCDAPALRKKFEELTKGGITV